MRKSKDQQWLAAMKGLLFALLLALPISLGSARAEEPASGQHFENQEALLAELTRLANEVEKERKYSALLQDKIDILLRRLDALEKIQARQAKQLSSLLPDDSKAKDGAEAGSKAGNQIGNETGNEGKSAEALTPPTTQVPSTQAPSESIRPDEAKPKTEKEMTEDFERFLGMAESMMRRFFGMVQDLRKEFEDSRA